jgi:hypothetical protein
MESQAILSAVMLVSLFRRLDDEGMRRIQSAMDRGKEGRNCLQERGLEHVGIDTASGLNAPAIAPAIIERAHDSPERMPKASTEGRALVLGE